jgi:hypothetical protein
MSRIELPGATPPPAPKPIGSIELVVYDDGNFNLKLNMPHAAMAVEYLVKAASYTIDKAKADATRVVQAAPPGMKLLNGRIPH